MQLSTRYASYPFEFFSLYLRRWLEMVESLVLAALALSYWKHIFFAFPLVRKSSMALTSSLLLPP